MKDQIRKTECMISVVICTHNRVKSLRDALQSVCVQDFPSENFEIIIVDNASTDETPLVGQEFCEKYPFIRYVMESNVGLSHARNRGWQEARGGYIAYLDDDAKASPQWLEAACHVIKEYSPALLGGPYQAFFDGPKPDWFKDSYGSRSLGDQPGQLHQRFLSGNNFFVRRDVFDLVGGFNPELGMSGNRIAYAEEILFQRSLRENFPNEMIYYDPEILIFHLVRFEKHNLWWRVSSSFASGRDYYRSHTKRDLSVAIVVTNTFELVFEIISVGLKFVFRDRKQYPFWQNYVYEQVRSSAGKAGKVFASWLYFLKLAH